MRTLGRGSSRVVSSAEASNLMFLIASRVCAFIYVSVLSCIKVKLSIFEDGFFVRFFLSYVTPPSTYLYWHRSVPPSPFCHVAAI